MKKAVLLGILIAFIGCNNYGPPKGVDLDEKLVGTWVNGDVYYILREDHTGVTGNKVEGDDIFSWRVIGKRTLQMTIGFPRDTTNLDISFQSDNTLIIDNTFKFRKIVKN